MNLFSKKGQCEILKTESDDMGRILINLVQIKDKKIILANIYAPNNDDPGFFEKLVSLLETFADEEVDGTFIGGDFNLVMDPKVDRNDSEYNHVRALDVINEYLDRTNMCDIWRIRNINTRKYTWHKWSRTHKPLCSRIDMLLVPMSYVDCVTRCEIEAGFHTDHSMVSMSFKIDNFDRGPGVWKFNNLLLNDECFINLVNQEIVKCGEVDNLNDNEMWEYVKMNIGRLCKDYAKKKAQKERTETKRLLHTKTELEEEALRCDGADRHVLYESLKGINNQINAVSIKETERSIFCSKCRYVRDGEKCSKYFFSLEKKRYLEKNMKCVINEEGKMCTKQKSILDEQVKFFKQLYKLTKRSDLI